MMETRSLRHAHSPTSLHTANLRGSLFMVLAMIGFAMEDALFKAATATGTVSPGLATLFFGLGATAISVLLARRAGVAIWTGAYLQPPLLIRTGFELMGRLFFALSLAYTPLSTTSAILQAAPLVVTLGAALILREKVGPRRWVAMIVGFFGVLLIIRPDQAGLAPNAILAILGMIGFAGRDLATRTSPPHVHSAQLGVLGFAVVSAAGLVILVFEAVPPGTPSAFAALCIGGTAAIGVAAYNALTVAMRTGEVSVVAPFRYSRLLVALVIAVVVFGERPGIGVLAGASLIVISGTYTLLRTRPRR